ncbi:MAG: gliding motility-associated C-terminal domain-containing protein [Bacteroidetes bacterium]|nr:gliding motility-associated C-terminal domain-containing protein [Bacteroidota bacterium]
MSWRLALLIMLLIVCGIRTYATHQRAAEITYKHIGGLTYEFTITMYTYTPSPADDVRTTLPIKWGDNTQSDIPRVVFQALPNNYTLNVYRMTHTFPASGTYTISVEDPNRNFGVVNIPNSVNVPMYVETTLVINPFLGVNNSVQLLNPPVDQGCVNRLFVHNPSAFDPDGDSLAFKLTSCRGANGQVIPGYTLPMASTSFEMNPLTGDLIWQNPMLQGEYNVAFTIEEWRNGVLVGTVTRDMQILIGACNNNPPVINAPAETCVLAGNFISFSVSATDPDNNAVVLSASGGPFVQPQNPAVINPDPASGTPTATTTFQWSTTCSHIRRNAYDVLFKARDIHPEISLTSFASSRVLVMAPAVQNLQATALGNGINLQWNPYTCNNAVGYKVYRSLGQQAWTPLQCETGVPAGSGYQLIATINQADALAYRDDANGQGLAPGNDYCYLVTAIFADGAESKASNPSCARLRRDLPVITNVTNDSLNLNSGRVWVVWSKPTELDTQQFPGPYEYQLFRLSGLTGQNPELVHTAQGLNDTIFYDQNANLNNQTNGLSYQIMFRSLTAGDIGLSRRASSVLLKANPSDRAVVLSWQTNVPWNNSRTEIFGKPANSETFTLLGSTGGNTWRHENLANGDSYHYYVRTVGAFSSPGFIAPIVNHSNVVSAVPVDNTPPCPPVLSVTPDCERIENLLSWSRLPDSCGYDLKRIRVYFATKPDGAFTLIDSLGPNTLSYLHQKERFVVGCYYLTAVDSTGNVSEASNKVCIDYDACPLFEIPNFFSPNGDGFNDELIPMGFPANNPNANINRIDLTIFNRWGNVVFKTDKPEIRWNGKVMGSGTDVADGTYFYVCDVFFEGLEGEVKLRLQGSITVMR